MAKVIVRKFDSKGKEVSCKIVDADKQAEAMQAPGLYTVSGVIEVTKTTEVKDEE